MASTCSYAWIELQMCYLGYDEDFTKQPSFGSEVSWLIPMNNPILTQVFTTKRPQWFSKSQNISKLSEGSVYPVRTPIFSLRVHSFVLDLLSVQAVTMFCVFEYAGSGSLTTSYTGRSNRSYAKNTLGSSTVNVLARILKVNTEEPSACARRVDAHCWFRQEFPGTQEAWCSCCFSFHTLMEPFYGHYHWGKP